MFNVRKYLHEIISILNEAKEDCLKIKVNKHKVSIFITADKKKYKVDLEILNKVDLKIVKDANSKIV